MKLFVRFIGILSIVILGIAVPMQVMAQSVTLTATPSVIGLEESVTLTAGGLTANQTYTLEVTFEDGSSVFITERTTNNSGQLVLTLTSEPTDIPGEYTVSLSLAGDEIATTSFTLANRGGNQGDADGANASSNVRVIPDTAAVGNTHNILVSGLESNETVTVQIRYGDDDTLKYTRRIDADDNGRIQLEIFTEEQEDLPGEYRIVVIDGNSETVGTATMTLTDFIGRDGVMTIVPITEDEVITYNITTTELKPFADLTITITNEATNERIFLTRQRADVDGMIMLEYDGDDAAAAGEYRVDVLEDDVVVASGSFVMGDMSVVPLQTTAVTIAPAVGTIGTAHTIVVNGLGANSTFTLDIIFEGTEDNVYTTERTANDAGNFEFVIVTEESDEIGTYRVDISQDGLIVGATTFTVIGDDTASGVEDNSPSGTAMITPNVADAGQSHIITASGLGANMAVVVQIVANDGTIVTERTATSDTNGNIALSVATDETTGAGDYSVNVVADGDLLATTALTIEGDVVAQPADDILVTITPPVGTRGTEHTIEVSGLDSDETISLDVRLDGNTLFSTQLTANADGIASTVIFSEESDAAGDYDIVVMRGDEQTASAILTIEEAVATGDGEEDNMPEVAPFDGTISVNPPSAERGAIHTITVAGLDANETVTFQVILGEAVLYETERSADANGSFDIDIQSDATDAFGVYQVAILREGVIVGQESLTVERPIASNEDDTDSENSLSETDTTVIGDSIVYEGTLNGDRPEATYELMGETGDVVYIALNSDEFDSYLTLEDSSGFVIAENDDGGGSLNSVIGPIVLDFDDTYTIVASSYDYSTSGTPESGAYELVVNNGSLSTLAYGDEQSIRFDADSGLQFFSIEAEIGDIISVEVVGDGTIDTVLRLIDPFNNEAVFDDDSGAGFDPEINRYIVTTAGTYIVALAPFNAGDSGDVTLVVDRRGALSLDEDAQTIQLNSKSNREVLVLEGAEGDEYQLRITELGSNTSELYINVTQGDFTVMNYNSSWGIPDEMMLGFVLPTDGSVSIIIESYDSTRLEVEVIPVE